MTAHSTTYRPLSFTPTCQLLLRGMLLSGLVVDAVVHLKLAPTQPPALDGHLSQVSLFYGETVVAFLAAALVLVWNRRSTAVVAALVSGTALAAVLQSRFVDIGAIGPVPDLYEPAWYASKVLTTVAEAVAFVAAIALATVPRRAARRGGTKAG
jgi:hypothetical protein